jgi:hypothetical protein
LEQEKRDRKISAWDLISGYRKQLGAKGSQGEPKKGRPIGFKAERSGRSEGSGGKTFLDRPGGNLRPLCRSRGFQEEALILTAHFLWPSQRPSKKQAAEPSGGG